MAASNARIRDTLTVTLPSDREIVMTRVFDAPRRLVFEAWTKPEHVVHWRVCWGSKVTVCEIDLRPGGAWRIVTRAPDGSEYKVKGVYQEIVPPARLVYTECFDEPGIGSPQWLTTITFEEQDGKTTMTSTFLHASVEVRDGHLQSGLEEGAGQTLDHLAGYLRRIA